MHSRPAFRAWIVTLGCIVLGACASTHPPGASGTLLDLALPQATAHPPRHAPIDVEHYALDIELDPAARSVSGLCRVRLWPAADVVPVGESLSEVALDFAGLTVRSVADDAGRTLHFAHSNGVLRIELAEPLVRGRFVELAVRYDGKPQKGLWFVHPRAGVATQVFTQGECEDARFWFPCLDVPSDRATSEVRVTMPASWTAVAAGERVERTEHDGKAIERWRMPVPHPAYLMTLVAGEFEQTTQAWQGVPLTFLAERALAPSMPAAFEKTGDVLEFFSKLTGVRYPYAKYSQACVANFPFGGMENISATTLTDTALTDERGRRDSPSMGLVAHEAAHQWFGDLLTCADWSHVWLNEGFATYLAALYEEHDRGIDEFRIQMADMQSAYVKSDVGANRRPIVHDVYCDPMDLFFTGHVYGGAAVRLHLLRSVVGDAAFFRGLQRYTSGNAGRAVVTADLQAAMESAAGVELAWFFDTWFEKPGFPEFQVSWRYDEQRKLVLLTVNQVQDPGDGTPAVFRTPVDVEIRDAGGTHVSRLAIDQRRHLFSLPCELPPTWVRFDAHGFVPKLIDDKKATSEWLAIAASNGDVDGRRGALRVLGTILERGSDLERESARDAIVERLASDASGAVRAAAAAELGSRARLECRPALERAAAGDGEARVRVAALTALRTFAPDAALSEFARAQYRSEFSYGAMAAAAGLLRVASPETAFEFLTDAFGAHSAHDVLRGSLIHEIGEVNDPRVVPLLRTLAVDEGASDASRVAAVSALGRVGRGDAAVRTLLLAQLNTESWRVRREAIAALGALNDPAVRAPLAEYHRNSVHTRERRAIEAILTAPIVAH